MVELTKQGENNFILAEQSESPAGDDQQPYVL